MAIPRKDALARLKGMLPRVEEHLAKWLADPKLLEANDWRNEALVGSNRWRRSCLMSGKKLLSNGKHVSRPSAALSKTKAARKRRLEKLLAAAFDSFNSKKNAACKRDFVFHMTDWMDQLEALSELYQDPEEFDKAQATPIVADFLYHALWHVRAAARLMLQFEPEDIFKDSAGTQARESTNK